jgi:hypothetical protein
MFLHLLTDSDLLALLAEAERSLHTGDTSKQWPRTIRAARLEALRRNLRPRSVRVGPYCDISNTGERSAHAR